MGAQGREPETFASFQWPVWPRTPSPPLLPVSELCQPPKRRESGPILEPITHVAASSAPCWVLPTGSRMGLGAGPEWGRWTWGGEHTPFRRLSPPTPASEEAPGLSLGSCCLSALPVSLPLPPSVPPLCIHEDYLTSATPLSLPSFNIPAPLCPPPFFPSASGHTSESL